jgi:hypothetical protein
MAKNNHARVSDALDLLNKGLLPFLERELRAFHGEKCKKWLSSRFVMIVRGQRFQQRESPIGTLRISSLVMWDQWNSLFS